MYFYNYQTTATEVIEKTPIIENLQKTIISDWAKYKKNGLVKGQNQQLITKPSEISSYVAKYDICNEMTKGNIKGSKGLTPFTALAKLALNDYEQNEKSLLFGLYSCYVENLHGKHFVNISNSLRELYKDKIKDLDKTDEEIVNETSIDEVLLKISQNVWTKIAKNDLQPIILIKFKENGLDGVYNLLTHYNDFKDLSIEVDKDVPIIKNDLDYATNMLEL